MITATNLTRNYGSLIAVDDVSFSIGKGEVVGLLGHNGAGKTTIMKMMTGYLEPTAGEIEVDGIKISENRIPIQEKIGYLPENCPVYPEMTVIDYLRYIAELRSIPEEKQDAAISDVINKTELHEKAGALINTLSKGYRQRVGIAQAMIHKPQILILDEPTNGLDPSQIQEIRSLIRSLSEHSTIILSTHILQEVEAVCDRAIIILNGKVALDSRLDELQNSNRLTLTVDREESEVRNSLNTVNGITAVNLISSEGEEKRYAVEYQQNGSSVSPQVAKAVMDNGFKLFSLEPERKDLEGVFREINSTAGEKQ